MLIYNKLILSKSTVKTALNNFGNAQMNKCFFGEVPLKAEMRFVATVATNGCVKFVPAV